MFAENNSVEPEVKIDQQLLAWMVSLCKQLLSEYQSDPKISDDDRFDAFHDRIVSIEYEAVGSGLENFSDDEIDRIERPYRKALGDTNWWVGFSC